MALGTLARHGPLHGHQIRRAAEVTNVGEWGGVSVGALYRELRVMERDGLIERVRTEQVGRRPERTVYQITAEGHLELVTLREQAIRPMWHSQDPLGVALSFAADGMESEELRGTLRARRNHLAIAADQLRAERARLVARGYVGLLQATIIRRAQVLLEAEVCWHDELDEELGHDQPLTRDTTEAAAAAARAAAASPASDPDDNPRQETPLCQSSRQLASPARSRAVSGRCTRFAA
jgi:DNA-binding PadR family transcriptional regulator